MASIDIAINMIARDFGTGDALGGLFRGIAGLATLINQNGGVFQALSKHFQDQGMSAADAEKKTEALQKTLGTLAVTAETAGVMFSAFKTVFDTAWEAATKLDVGLTRVGIATQTSADAMPALTTAINDLAIKTVYGSDEAAGAFERLSEMGFNVSQMLYGMKAPADEYKQHAYDAAEATNGLGYQALVLGQAMKDSAEGGAQLLGAALHTFEKDGMTATEAANLLAGAYFNGVPSASALTQAIQMGGAQASTAGISMHDYMTILDLLAQSGMSASSAGASLSYMIQSMISPTQKQAKMMSDLGIMTANEATPAFGKFEDALRKAGGATEDQMKLWSGSVTGLQNMFDAAKNVGIIPLDANFNQWALKAGFLQNNLFDASGKFVGMKDAIKILDEAMQGMSVEEKMAALGDLFNIRSGRAARILTDLGGFSEQYQTIWDKMGATDVTSAAQKQLETWAGASEAFRDSLTSALGVAMLPFTKAAAELMNHLNGLLSLFMQAPPQVQQAVAIFIAVGLAFSGIVAAGAGIAGVVILLGALGIAIGPILAIVAIVAAGILGLTVILTAGISTVIDWLHQAGEKGTWMHEHLKPALDSIAGIWKTFNDFLHDQALPLWKQWEPVLQTVGKVLLIVAGIIVVVVIVAILLIIGAILLVIAMLITWLNVMGWFKDRMGEIIGHVIEFFRTLPTNIQIALTHFAEAIGAAKDNVGRGMDMVRNSILNSIASLPGRLLDAAHHMMDMFIQGIRDRLGELFNVFGSIPDKLWRLLGFGSPTEEGPGAEADTWAPNFMRMYTAGVRSGIPHLRDAAEEAADALNLSPSSSPLSYSARAASGSGGSGGRQNLQPVNVYIGNDQVYEGMLDHVTGTLRTLGINRLGR